MKRRAAAALAIGAVLAGSAVAAQGDEPIEEVSWWSRQVGASAPDGGFAVAAGPDGDISVAALRVIVPRGLERATLRLTPTSATSEDVAALKACPTVHTWKPASPGSLADAPDADCKAASVELQQGDTGDWAADVTEVVRAAHGALMIVPAAWDGPPVPFVVPRYFEVQFGAPSMELETSPRANDSITAAPGPPSTAGSFDTPPPSAIPTTSVRRRSRPAPPPSSPEREELAASSEPGGSTEVAFEPLDAVPDESLPFGRLGIFVPLSLIIGAASGAMKYRLDRIVPRGSPR